MKKQVEEEKQVDKRRNKKTKEESSKNEPINQDKVSDFIDNPVAFLAEEISQAGQGLGQLFNALADSSNPEDREYYQERNGEINNLKGDMNRSPKRSRSSKQPKLLESKGKSPACINFDSKYK